MWEILFFTNAITMMYQVQTHLQLLSSFSKLSEIYQLLTVQFINQYR